MGVRGMYKEVGKLEGQNMVAPEKTRKVPILVIRGNTNPAYRDSRARILLMSVACLEKWEHCIRNGAWR